MNYYSILYTEINLISIALIVILCMKSKKLKQIKAYPNYIKAVTFMTIFIVSDMISLLMTEQSIPYTPGLIMVFKSLYFTSGTIMSYFWLIYFEYKGNTVVAQKKGYQYGLSVLAVLQVIITLFNFHYGFFFYSSKEVIYTRGPLFFTQYIFCYLYIGIAIIRALYAAVFMNNYVDREYILTLAVFPILPALAGISQFFYPKVPVLCICLTLSAFLLYMNSIDDLIFADPLTGLSNRRNFMHIISSKMKGYDGSEKLYLIMADVDYFKEINDGYGHVEGDKALKQVSEVLAHCALSLGQKAQIGRFGGDEFIELVELKEGENIDDYVANISETLQKVSERKKLPYPLTISIGYAKYQSSYKMVRDFISEADKKLYVVKEQRHKEVGKNSR